ncbi:unnamed protein product, partial [Brenthis ino]
MIYQILFYSMILYGVHGQTCNFNVKIGQKLRNEGFHRNLSYYIDFASDDEEENWLYRDCSVGLEQTLPSGVYASEDEMRDHGCRNLVETVFITPVNIELPAKDASPIVMQMFSKVKNSKTQFHIPVHARYHQASRGGGTAKNEIPPPKLYLKCPDNKLNVCNKYLPPQTSVNTFCKKHVPKELCDWKLIPAIMVTDTIIWEVPIGNTDHYYLVAWGTSVVIVVGSLYLLKNLHKYNFKVERRIIKKHM